jgi:ArsR family transcriptional regulator, arsenate/arsenite/antimonite-responsive transcriptional repressor
MEVTPLDSIINVHKALAHPARVRILAMLRGAELCVCQLNAVIGVAPSTISAHLAELREAGLVAERKDGRWVHYRIAASGAAESSLKALWQTLENDATIAADTRLLERVTALPVEAICRPEFDASTLRDASCTNRTTRRKGCT